MRALFLSLLLLPVAAAEERRDDAAAEMAKADDYFFTKKDYPAAIAHYNAARLLAPDRPGPYLALGIAYRQIEDCKSATAMMTRYLQVKVGDPKPDAQRILDECKARAGACPPGQVKNADTAGHCCWPAQVWAMSENRCVGDPACPPGFVIGPHQHGCLATGSCPAGKVVAQDPTQCCWPGQGYSHEKHACVGAPQCPPGLMPDGVECVPLDLRAQINERVSPVVAACHRTYRGARGQLQLTLVVRGDGSVESARVAPPFERAPMGICVTQSSRSVTFPPSAGARTINYPFTLR